MRGKRADDGQGREEGVDGDTEDMGGRGAAAAGDDMLGEKRLMRRRR